MNKQQKLEAIYEAMADKTLSEWCIAFNKVSWTNDIVWNICINCDDKLFEPRFDRFMEKDEYKIIWHPVRIWCVLEYWDFEWTEHALLNLWDNKRLPIDDQSDDAISFVFDLINR